MRGDVPRTRRPSRPALNHRTNAALDVRRNIKRSEGPRGYLSGRSVVMKPLSVVEMAQKRGNRASLTPQFGAMGKQRARSVVHSGLRTVGRGGRGLGPVRGCLAELRPRSWPRGGDAFRASQSRSRAGSRPQFRRPPRAVGPAPPSASRPASTCGGAADATAKGVTGGSPQRRRSGRVRGPATGSLQTAPLHRMRGSASLRVSALSSHARA